MHRLHHSSLFFFFNDTATTEIYTLSLHDALPISALLQFEVEPAGERLCWAPVRDRQGTLGVLAIVSGQPDAFSDEDARALSTVCGQLALAFRNHEFIGRIRAYSERLATTGVEGTETPEPQIRLTGQDTDSRPI